MYSDQGTLLGPKASLVSQAQSASYSQGQTIVDSVMHFDCNFDLLVDCDCDMIFCDPSIKLYPGSPRKGKPKTGPVLVLELGCHAGVSRFACFVMTEHFFHIFRRCFHCSHLLFSWSKLEFGAAATDNIG